MPQPEALYQLQQIDLKILSHRKRLGEIASALKDRTDIVQAEQAVETARKALAPVRTKSRDLELEIQSNTQKAKAAEDRLYSGKVKSPKELQDMQQEIESLKHRKEQLEEILLETMIAVEEAESALEDSETTLNTITAAWESDHRDLLAEQSDLEQQIENLQQQREKALAPITEESLKRYNSMRKQKANQPISPMRQGSCSVCGMEQTMAVQQAVRRGETTTCENCGRILADI